MKPPIPYFGSKQRIAEQIVKHFPAHEHYIEPYAGSLSVWLAKGRAKIETLNDLDHELMTFWRVLRDSPEDLMRACTLTPHSRAELALARESTDGLSDLEIARRVWVQLSMSRSGQRASTTGWRFCVDTESIMAAYLGAYVRRMPPAAARLADAQLECMPAIDLIAQYGAKESALIYVDPPYLATTRAGGQRYHHEMGATAQHAELAEALAGCSARVVLSGYRSADYDTWYSGWRTIEIDASAGRGARSQRARTEVLWCNFEPDDHLFSEVPA